ncbi:MAG: phosphatidate cytidylyltransferase, partial [Candidatus Cloacimonetes bacterium]|nr:phosphatidate cytidylyltransferase [Candidatus Cloacimonadota bacterium]
MNLLRRIIIAIIFIPVVLLILYRGGWPLAMLLAMVSFLQLFEIRELLIRRGIVLTRGLLPLGIVVFFAAASGDFRFLLAALLVTLLLLAGRDLFLNNLEGSFLRVSAAMLALVYSPLLLASAWHIRMLPAGRYLLISLMAVIWLTDTAAYFTGITIGRHKGIFRASPGKTMEGFLAGILAAFAFACLAALIFGFSARQALALGLATGLFGQLGDLLESMFKRDWQVKDSSSLLPGHGGLLDRFDSLLLAAPSFY